MKSSDDIFAFFHNIFLKDISGLVVDSISAEPIEHAKVSYYTNNKVEKVVYTDSLGHFTIPYTAHAKCVNNHHLTISEENYLTKTINVPCSATKELLIALFNNRGIHSLEGYISDADTREPIENVRVTLKGLKKGNDTTFTNSAGKYSFHKIPSNDYVVIRAAKEGYLNDSRTLITPDNQATVNMSKKNGFNTDFNMFPIKNEIEFEIKNIYYEFDKARLLPESEEALNNLINLMNENPGLRIKINSHTDTRGTDVYNMQLSDKRSNSVVTYLLQAGINSGRLKAQGFGESNPAIKNATTEEEHQKNRRTTFEILGDVEQLIVNTDSLNNKTSTVALPPKLISDNKTTGTEMSKSNDLSTSYRIQLVATNQTLDTEKLLEELNFDTSVYKIVEVKNNGLHKYQLGNFSTREEAETIKIQCQAKGYQDCFIVIVN
jgi:outer membrane protein OmpA-like peptidoglycan-associated protein